MLLLLLLLLLLLPLLLILFLLLLILSLILLSLLSLLLFSLFFRYCSLFLFFWYVVLFDLKGVFNVGMLRVEGVSYHSSLSL